MQFVGFEFSLRSLFACSSLKQAVPVTCVYPANFFTAWNVDFLRSVAHFGTPVTQLPVLIPTPREDLPRQVKGQWMSRTAGYVGERHAFPILCSWRVASVAFRRTVCGFEGFDGWAWNLKADWIWLDAHHIPETQIYVKALRNWGENTQNDANSVLGGPGRSLVASVFAFSVRSIDLRGEACLYWCHVYIHWQSG